MLGKQKIKLFRFIHLLSKSLLNLFIYVPDAVQDLGTHRYRGSNSCFQEIYVLNQRFQSMVREPLRAHDILPGDFHGQAIFSTLLRWHFFSLYWHLHLGYKSNGA